MKSTSKILFLVFFFISFAANSHNPENFVISEIERGQLNFENEKIAAEYGAALKRQRIRRLNAMSWLKKIYIFIIRSPLIYTNDKQMIFIKALIKQ